MRFRDLNLLGPLALAALLAAVPAAATSTFVLDGGVVDPPASVGPVGTVGSVGSTGEVFGAIDRGRFQCASRCSNPVTGLFTPQVDAPMSAAVTATDMHVIASDPLYDPQGITITMHMLLTGDVAVSGPNPFEGNVMVRAMGSNYDIISTMIWNGAGLSTTGLLAGAPTHMVDYPLDFQILVLASPSNTQYIALSLSTRAYGTSVGTDVNTASSDFSGQGLRFPTLTPAFEPPAGISVSIPSLNIVNNYWVDPAAGVAPATVPGRLALAALRNPVRGAARFALTLPADGAARGEVYDVRGRRVATLLDGWQAAGSRELAWDGAGGAGAGVYFVRVSTGREQATTRIVVVK
jgi:hypothetical protein